MGGGRLSNMTMAAGGRNRPGRKLFHLMIGNALAGEGKSRFHQMITKAARTTDEMDGEKGCVSARQTIHPSSL
jgi:hypothetical protein